MTIHSSFRVVKCHKKTKSSLSMGRLRIQEQEKRKVSNIGWPRFQVFKRKENWIVLISTEFVVLQHIDICHGFNLCLLYRYSYVDSNVMRNHKNIWVSWRSGWPVLHIAWWHPLPLFRYWPKGATTCWWPMREGTKSETKVVWSPHCRCMEWYVLWYSVSSSSKAMFLTTPFARLIRFLTLLSNFLKTFILTLSFSLVEEWEHLLPMVWQIRQSCLFHNILIKVKFNQCKHVLT